MPGGRDGTRRPLPYLRVFEALRRDLVTLREGTRLPSETLLAERYGVSRMTARKAVLALRQEGLVFVERNRGAFVATRRIDLHGGPIAQGFSARVRAAGLVPTSRLLRFERGEADLPTASALHLPVGTAIYHLERLRKADGVALAHEVTTIPVAICPALYRYDLERESLYRILTDIQRLRPSTMVEQVEAGAAGRRLARWFRGSATDPVLIARRVLLDDTGRALECTTATYRGDRYRATYRLLRTSEPADWPERG